MDPTFKSQLDFSKSTGVPVLEELIYVKDSVSIPVKIYLDGDSSGNITNQGQLSEYQSNRHSNR